MKIFKGLKQLIIMAVFIAIILIIVTALTPKPELTYSDFLIELKNRNVDTVDLKDSEAKVVLKADSSADTERKAGEYKLKIYDQGTFEQLIIDEVGNGNQVKYTADITQVPLIVRVIPYILLCVAFLFVIYLFLQSRNGGKGHGFSRSNARLYTDSNVSFKDVAGCEEEKGEMEEIVSFLKDPEKYRKLGARIPKGVLLVGPPGTGKTYLAKAVAGEAGVPFFSISGSDFVELYVGVGASRVRDLFEQAKKNSPCIIFVDEIDAVGRHRGAGMGGGNDEREQTLNQMLIEMDGFGTNEGVIVMAATNRPDILDPALTRPGRFDRKIVVNYPDIKGRESILEVHSKNKPLSEDVSLNEIAKDTSGFTAADLENLLNEAALLAAKNNKDKIDTASIKEAVFRVIVGTEKKSKIISDKSKWLTAVHETGHAMIVKLVSSTDKVDRVSVIPAGMAGGYTAHRPEEDSDYITKNQLLEHIDIALGGRAAEEIILNEISTGASSDLKSANSIAKNMVTRYGMSDTIGNMIFSTNESDEVFLGKDYGHVQNVSEEMSSQIDREIKKILDSEYIKVKNILLDNKEKLTEIARILAEKERIEGEEFEELMKG